MQGYWPERGKPEKRVFVARHLNHGREKDETMYLGADNLTELSELKIQCCGRSSDANTYKN